MNWRRLLTLAALPVLVAASAAASSSGGVAATDGVWRVEPAGSATASSSMISSRATAVDDVGTSVAAALARARSTDGSPLRELESGKSFIRVVVEAEEPASAKLVAKQVQVLGGRVEIRYGGLVQAWVPPSALNTLARADAVATVRPPALFVPMGNAGEGVAATNAPAWQTHGLTGKGVKIAIFDWGFGGLAERQASGEIPASAVVADFCGGRVGGPETHGTGVAEVVAEQAPEAQLYLVCIDTDVSLGPALAYAKANGVNIVNMSGAFYNTWRGDGKGPAGTPDAIVAEARASGMLWVNAAGNEARTHWAGTFASADGDPFNEFAPGDEGITVEVRPGTTICGFLRWDSWPVAGDDYDLAFVDSSVGLVAASTRWQVRDRLPPTEALCVTNVSGRQRFGAFVIAREVGAAAPTFDLFVDSSPYVTPIEYPVATRSIVDPAASSNAIAAGAVCWQNGLLETYSSQGPTIDNRVKPDLVAPDSVSSATYGPFTSCGVSGFAGTSASAPHLAGAAALLRERFPSMPAADLQTLLTKESVDAGVAGPDNVYGAGRLYLHELPQALLKAQPARGRYGRNVTLHFNVKAAQWDVRHHVHVFRGSTPIRSFVLPFAHAHEGWVRSVTWRAPRPSGTARYRFCVEAWDRPEHASTRSCAGISLSR